MGNTVVMKLPRCGVLCHWPTMALFRDCFPPGVVPPSVIQYIVLRSVLYMVLVVPTQGLLSLIVVVVARGWWGAGARGWCRGWCPWLVPWPVGCWWGADSKVNIISGSGRETMPPIMATGLVDIFAFIGTSKAADSLQQAHTKVPFVLGPAQCT